MADFRSYAQNFEDVMLWRALGGVPAGFYIDVGAQDPVVDSVSLAFYEHGWRGVHVEPVAHFVERLRVARPDEEVIAAAVSDAPGLITFYEIDDTGLSTGDEAIAQRHVEAGYAVRKVSVPALTLDELFDRVADREVHWLKIDVEGLEAAALRGWTRATPRPWIIVIESAAPVTREDTSVSWDRSLTDRGYRFAWFDGLNRFYVAPDHPELLDAFTTPPNVFDRFVLAGSASSTFTAGLASTSSGRIRATTLDQALADVAHLRAAFDVLVAEVDARRENGIRLETAVQDALTQTAELQRELVQRDRRYEAFVERSLADLAAQQQRQDGLAAELVAAVRHSGEITRQLTESHANVLYLKQSLATAERRAAQHAQALAAANAAYDSIRSSRSWRMTAPLRHLFGIARRCARALAPARLVELPRRAAKRVVLSSLEHVRRHPRRKAMVARMVRRVPRLDARLRRMAAANPASGIARAPSAVAPTPAATLRSTPTGDASSVVPPASLQEHLRRSASAWPLGTRRNV